MYCSKCGAEIREGSKFCTNCGAPTGSATTDEANESQTGSRQADQTMGGSSKSSQSGYTAGRNSGPDKRYNNTQSTKSNGTGDSSGLKTAATIVALVFAVFYLIAGLRRISSIFSSVRSIFYGYLFSGGIRFINAILALITSLIFACLLALFALYRNDENKEHLYLGVVVGRVLRTAAGLIQMILLYVLVIAGRYIFSPGYFFNFLRTLFFAALAIAALFGISYLCGDVYLLGKSGDQITLMLSELGDVITQQINIISDHISRNRKDKKNNTTANGQSAASGGAYEGTGAGSYRGAAGGQYRAITTKRGLIKYIIFTVITCGIYDLYFYYAMARDLNIICDSDGRKKTAGLIKLLLLSVITCGIYYYYWLYKFAERVQDNGTRYGVTIKEGGSTILLWDILGSLLCGIGSFVALHLLIRNFNTLANAYNQTNNIKFTSGL